MPIHSEQLESYLEKLARPADAQLEQLTQLGRERRFPIVGPQVGRFLEQLVHLLGARRIFELGSGFGYSTLWFARALPAEGVIHHTDGDQRNSQEAQQHLAAAGLIDRCRFYVGDAVQVLKSQPEGVEFDIVFCDIDKHGYPDAYDQMIRRVRVGGAIVIDNLIWSGKIADPKIQDADTAGIREFQRRMWGNPNFLSSLLPLRDGVGLHLRLR